MYYIGLDAHKKTISYCVKDASGQVHQEGLGSSHSASLQKIKGESFGSTCRWTRGDSALSRTAARYQRLERMDFIRKLLQVCPSSVETSADPSP